MVSGASIRRSLHGLVLGVVVAATFAVPIAAADSTDIDGTYALTLTATKECQQPNDTIHPGFTVHLAAKVAQNGSTVSCTLAGRAVAGSIDAGLNFDAPVGEDHWIGHFTALSDGGMTISGQVVGQCSGATGPYMQITGRRTSGGPTPSATPSPNLLERLRSLPGYSAGDQALENYCPGGSQPTTCDASSREGQDWLFAMSQDRNALSPPPSPDLDEPLAHLMLIVQKAAQLGTLTYTEVKPNGSCTPPRPLYPLERDAPFDVESSTFVMAQPT